MSKYLPYVVASLAGSLIALVLGLGAPKPEPCPVCPVCPVVEPAPEAPASDPPVVSAPPEVVS